MSTHYDPDEKTAVMVLLERNRGDIQHTADQTGIPDRTIRRWRGQILAQLRRYPLSRTIPAENVSVPAFDSDMDALAFIRQNIINELSRLSASLQYDSSYTTPYQRAQVLAQLMDKLLKLDGHIRPFLDDDDEMELSDDVEEVDDEEDA